MCLVGLCSRNIFIFYGEKSMSFDELMKAAKASSGDPLNQEDVRLFRERIREKERLFEKELEKQASDDVFLARSYTL